MARFRAFRSKPQMGALNAATGSGHVISTSHEVAEQMRLMLRRSALLDRQPAIVAITAATAGEGSSFIANSLGLTIAHDTELTVCIVDLDVAESADEENGSVVAVASGTQALTDALTPTDLDRLSLLGAGSLPLVSRAPFARSHELRQVVEDLADEFDVVILDVPALARTTDALPLTALAQQTVMVVRQGGPSADHVCRVMDDVGRDRLAGVVFNRVTGMPKNRSAVR